MQNSWRFTRSSANFILSRQCFTQQPLLRKECSSGHRLFVKRLSHHAIVTQVKKKKKKKEICRLFRKQKG